MPCSCFVLWDLIGFSAILDFHSYSPPTLCLSLCASLSLCINFVCKRSCWRILGVHSLSASSICSCSLCVLKLKTTSDLQHTYTIWMCICISYHAFISCFIMPYLCVSSPYDMQIFAELQSHICKIQGLPSANKRQPKGTWRGECVCEGSTKNNGRKIADIKIIKQQGVKSVKQLPQCKFYDPAMQWKRKWAKAEQIRPQAH